MFSDDGFAPLLPDARGKEQIKLPGRKLLVMGVLVVCFCIIDVFVSALCSTAGFSAAWARRLGLGHGPYPFGSSGLDLLLLSIVRAIVAAVYCAIFYGSLRRANYDGIEDVLHIAETGERVHDCVGRSAASEHAPGRAQRHRRGKTSGLPETGIDETDTESQACYVFPRLARRLELVWSLGCSAGLLFLVAKCLARLVVGPGPEDCGLRTAWFWLSIGCSIAASGTEFALVTGFTSICKRYWFLYRCRETGDIESALDPSGAALSGKKSGAYSANFGDVVMLCVEDWRLIAFASGALLVAACCEVLIPHFTGNIIDNVVEVGDSRDFRKSTLYLVLAAIACAFFTGTRGGIFSVVGARVNVRIRRRLFESLVSQEIGFFDTNKTGDLTSRLSNDCTKVGDQVTLNVNVFLRNFVMVVVTLLFMFYLSWRLSLVAFVSVPGIVTISKWYGSYIRRLSKLTQDKLAEAGTVAEESMSTMPTVRSFAGEGRETNEYASKLQEYYALSKKSGIAYGFYSSANNLLPNLVTAVVLYYGGSLVMEGNMTGGKVVSFMIYLDTLSAGFDDMANIFNSMTQAVGAADKVFELIRRKPKWNAPPPATFTPQTGSAVRVNPTPSSTEGPAPPRVAPAVCWGEVELENVHFEYPSRPGRTILDGISFRATPGQVLALVGPSGGGKTSCIALLENLYKPSRGRVMLDGRGVGMYDHRWLHRNVSIVGQEPVLYARSIRENIIYGLEDEEPSMEAVEEAARLANAHTFISQLPDKYETHAGERGVQMSGGQKQRIAIARALVRKPRVLLLDEATSALDAESEHLVQQAIDSMIARGGMTVILIAHRLSTVKRAHKIVVIKAGRVAEEGSHEELVATKGGVYSALVKRQLDLGDNADKEDIGQSTPGPSSFFRGRKILTDGGKTSSETLTVPSEDSSEEEG